MSLWAQLRQLVLGVPAYRIRERGVGEEHAYMGARVSVWSSWAVWSKWALLSRGTWYTVLSIYTVLSLEESFTTMIGYTRLFEKTL